MITNAWSVQDAHARRYGDLMITIEQKELIIRSAQANYIMFDERSDTKVDAKAMIKCISKVIDDTVKTLTSDSSVIVVRN